MPKCECCKKKFAFPFVCNYCSLNLCNNCINLESHNCSKLEDCIESKRKNLETELNKGKTIDKKIKSI